MEIWRRWRKRLCTVLISFCLIAGQLLPVGAQELNLYAKSAVLMDARSKRVLYEKNGSEVLPMASTTKIMTCILALEYGHLEDQVSFSEYAVSMPKVHLGAAKGNSYTMEDLLYSLMLKSHNDTAVAIAEHIAGGMDQDDAEQTAQRSKEESRSLVSKFAEMMNQKARDIGCEHTMFLTPNGLDAVLYAEDGSEQNVHSTTAEDLAKILSYCILDSPMSAEFLRITQTESVQISSLDQSQTHSLQNHNAFLKMMDGALSGKTGFTAKAGYCYVGALRQGDRVLVVALLACGWPNNKGYKWKDTRMLMEYGLEQFQWRTFSEVSSTEEQHFVLEVQDGQSATLDQPATLKATVQSGEGDEDGVLLRESETIQVSEEWNENLQAPIKQGDVVGMRSYMLDGVVLRSELILADETVDEISVGWCLAQVLKRFCA